VKNYEVLIEAAEILKNENLDFEIKLAGRPMLEKDKVYFEELKKLIKEKNLEDKIIFIGSVPYKDIADFYRSGDLFVNLSETGSLDKAVLEAMSSGLPVLTSNEAYFGMLEEKYLTKNDPKEIAEKIAYFIKNKINFAPELRQIVVKNHSLQNLIDKITQVLC